MTKRLGAATLIAILLPAAAARATEVSSAQLQALAGRAAGGDQVALSELRTVTTVDGQPARIAETLQSHGAQQLKDRLQTLATATPPTRLSPAAAQQQAAAILAGRRFSRAPVTDPVKSALDKLGRALGRLAGAAPGGPVAFWAVVAALILALTAVGVRRTVRRLDRTAAAAAQTTPTADTPDSLERRATEAEHEGAFADAVRLRFRAGLLRLGSRKLIDYNPAVLTSEVANRLHSPQFDALAASFERIAYGGAAAGASDAAAAREGWRALSGERGA
jgi:hypothetical protein